MMGDYLAGALRREIEEMAREHAEALAAKQAEIDWWKGVVGDLKSELHRVNSRLEASEQSSSIVTGVYGEAIAMLDPADARRLSLKYFEDMHAWEQKRAGR